MSKTQQDRLLMLLNEATVLVGGLISYDDSKPSYLNPARMQALLEQAVNREIRRQEKLTDAIKGTGQHLAFGWYIKSTNSEEANKGESE